MKNIMTWINKLKIGRKLLISFTIVALIAAMIGYIGINYIKQVNTGSKEIYRDNTIPLSYLINLTGHFQRLRANVIWFVQETDIQNKKIRMDLCEEREKSVKLYSDKFEETIHSDDIRAAFNQFKDAQGKLIPMISSLIQLAKQNETSQADSLLIGDFDKLRKTCEDALTNVTNLQIEHSKIKSEENEKVSDTASFEMVALLILGFLLAISLGIFVSGIISNPIKKLVNGANKVASGDYTGKLEIMSGDEIGDLASAFNRMIQNIKDVNEKIIKEKEDSAYKDEIALKESEIQKKYLSLSIDEMLIEMNKFSEGDLTVALEIKKDDEIGKLYAGFNNAVKNIKEILLKVAHTVASSATASSQISASSEEMAAGAQEQGSQTTEVAGAVEEMTKTILETTKNSSIAAETAKAAGNSAKIGGKVVEDTIEGMNRIAEVVKKSAETVQALGKSSDQIGEIIQVIDDIADQTNLLALNAAIEAARAGEQGRGFAVVADEVRKLAERTTKATKEIAGMIKQIQKDTTGAVESMSKGTDEVEKGKALADKAGESLKEIICGAEMVVDVVNQVAAASEEQSSTSEQISKSIETINNIAQENAGGISQIAKASEDLNCLTDSLQELIAKFKTGSQVDPVVKNHNKNDSKSQFAVRSNGVIVKS
jgi:methyl-accepting chemotaxis protein